VRIEIKSSDRLGISQEILSVFSSNAWNLKAIEVETSFTYVHIENVEVTLMKVHQKLEGIVGIIRCREISAMPSEKREKHLLTLLARIPDPIIDIDEVGNILTFNQATQKLLPENLSSAVGLPIKRFVNCSLHSLLKDKDHNISLTFNGQPFMADISPVYSDEKVSGAVISLRSINQLGRQISLMQSSKDAILDNIIGKSEKFKLIISQTLRFADLDLPVLISGETGTGKELIARALHQASKRKEAPFLTINCAALPEQLLESELFGYEPGAFTGAAKGGKPGLFELAHGGTVFLDEIAEMSIYLQAKLLRFLQDFSYRRLGGTKELTANIKVISATHQDLKSLIEQKLFREDLFYRLNVLKLSLPSLNKRIDDIPLLVEYFVNNAAKQVGQNKPVISPEALALLQEYKWPGNIRQLENAVFRLVALNDKAMIQGDDVETLLYGQELRKEELPLVNEFLDIQDWSSAQEHFERKLLMELYPLYPSTRKLAERLKVSHNKIAMKLRAYNIVEAV